MQLSSVLTVDRIKSILGSTYTAFESFSHVTLCLVCMSKLIWYIFRGTPHHKHVNRILFSSFKPQQTRRVSIVVLSEWNDLNGAWHFTPPMVFLSHKSSDTPGLAPLMNVLF